MKPLDEWAVDALIEKLSALHPLDPDGKLRPLIEQQPEIKTLLARLAKHLGVPYKPWEAFTFLAGSTFCEIRRLCC